MGAGKYCSTQCQHLGSRNGKFVKCHVCGKETYKPLKQINRSKSGNFFCGKSCQTKWRNAEFIGDKHANWKHGMYVYKSILRRSGVPAVCRLCNLKDDRVLAVHHIDKDHKNNRIDNLVWLCHNCHHLVHCDKKEFDKLTIVLGKHMVPMV